MVWWHLLLFVIFHFYLVINRLKYWKDSLLTHVISWYFKMRPFSSKFETLCRLLLEPTVLLIWNFISRIWLFKTWLEVIFQLIYLKDLIFGAQGHDKLLLIWCISSIENYSSFYYCFKKVAPNDIACKTWWKSSKKIWHDYCLDIVYLFVCYFKK